MTEPTNDKILNRVRALLDKAASTEFEGEAQALRDKAMELMAAYGIEQAVLEASGEKKTDTITTIKITFVNPYSYEKHILLRAIAISFGCKTILTPDGKSALYTEVVGHTSDLERVEFLYTLLLVQAETGAAKLEGDSYGGYYSPRQVAAQTRRLRAAYLYGFTREIGERLTAIQEHARNQSDIHHAGDSAPGAAVVLASRWTLVERAFDEFFPETAKRKSGRTYSQTGYAAGQAGGRNADLGQDRFGSRGKALTR